MAIKGRRWIRGWKEADAPRIVRRRLRKASDGKMLKGGMAGGGFRWKTWEGGKEEEVGMKKWKRGGGAGGLCVGPKLV